MIGETFEIAIQEVPHLNIEQVTRVLNRLDVPVGTTVIDRYSDMAGFLYADAGGGIIFIEASDPEERRTFSLAHELGHFVNDYYRPVYLKYENSNTISLFQEEGTVKPRQVISARCTRRDIFGDAEQEILDVKSNNTERLILDLQRQQKENYKEIKANFFAAELLMPMDECSRIEFESEGATREELTAGLIRRFGVSRAAAAIRVEELRLGVVEGSLF